MKMSGVDLPVQEVLANPTTASLVECSGVRNIDTPNSTCAVDDLCDELMLHTFECDQCIAGLEEECDRFCELRREIYNLGGPGHGAMMAI
jgi:hypothetical protein